MAIPTGSAMAMMATRMESTGILFTSQVSNDP